MSPDFMKGFAQELVRAGLAMPHEIRGCSKREVARLESYYGIRLPEAYRQFLSEMGHKAGIFYRGTDCFYRHLFDLREWMEETLSEDRSPFQLTKDAFVFSSHQGYIYHFFYTIESNPDPPVWSYYEGEVSPKQLSASY